MNSAEQPVDCPHCGHRIEQRYCPACGEQVAKPLRLAALLPGVLDQLLEFEYPLARTLKALLTKPASLVQRFWAGDRKHFTHPFKFCFWAATIDFALVLALDVGDRLVVGVENADEPLTWLLSFGQYLLFLYLIPTAWLLGRLCQPRVTPLAAYVALLYGFAGVHVLKILIMPFVLLPYDFIFWIYRLVTPAYLGWLLFNLLPAGIFSRAWRTALLYLVFVGFQIAVNSLLITSLRILGIVDAGTQ